MHPSKPKSAPKHHDATTKLLNYVLFFFVCAFIGWIWEVIITFCNTGHFVNRGVLHGPWLPIYGFGGVGIMLIIGRLYGHPLLVFLGSMTPCGMMEYFTGWYLEFFLHLKWWDYSNLPFNLQGRVCLLSLISFGLCGLIVVYIIYPRFHDLFARLKSRPKYILSTILTICFLIDFIYTTQVPNTGDGITQEVFHAIVDPHSEK